MVKERGRVVYGRAVEATILPAERQRKATVISHSMQEQLFFGKEKELKVSCIYEEESSIWQEVSSMGGLGGGEGNVTGDSGS